MCFIQKPANAGVVNRATSSCQEGLKWPRILQGSQILKGQSNRKIQTKDLFQEILGILLGTDTTGANSKSYDAPLLEFEELSSDSMCDFRINVCVHSLSLSDCAVLNMWGHTIFSKTLLISSLPSSKIKYLQTQLYINQFYVIVITMGCSSRCINHVSFHRERNI